MDTEAKIRQLRKCIEASIVPWITHDYVLYDLPYHANIGDTLIWEGEVALLDRLPFRCLDAASRLTCRFPALAEEVIILFHGGGNMGDLYPEHMEFLIKLTRTYPKNRILVFPQTFYYDAPSTLEADMRVLAAHDQLVICARDQHSYELVQPYFQQRTLLVPDMAFCIDTGWLRKCGLPQTKSTLYIKRVDAELKGDSRNFDFKKMVTRDWPTFEGRLFDGFFVAKVLNRIASWQLPFAGKQLDRLWNRYASTVYKTKLLLTGIRFISPFKKIYTTRLHGCILAFLLNKKVTLLDNSYGKNIHFYHTWLADAAEVDFLA